MPARTHYELLSVDPSASLAAIKTAFREQIARYHPDKVAHLGYEFQTLAAQRSAALTVAYKTLVDPTLRARYDETIARAARDPEPPGPRSDRPRFAAESADGDSIVHRALLGRVRSAVTDVYGHANCPRVRGFDLVMVPAAVPALMRSPFPRVFTRVRDVVEPAQVKEAAVAAARARLHVPGSPINVLLFGTRLQGEVDIVSTCEQVRNGRLGEVPPKTHVVVIDAGDWRAVFPADSPPALRRFVDRLRR